VIESLRGEIEAGRSRRGSFRDSAGVAEAVMMKIQYLKFVGLFAALGLALYLPKVLSDYWLYVLTVAFFYAVMAASWNLLAGYTG
jgi:hypothetical protein